MDQKQNLDKLRKEISDIDRQLLELLEARLKVARKIGEIKLSQNLPVKDYRVEKSVVERNKAMARKLGTYEEMAVDLSKLLIKYAVLAQDEYHNRSAIRSSTPHKKILVIGGAGRMGQWFVDYLQSFGHDVSVFCENGETPKSLFSENITFYQDFEKACTENEILVLATPISETSKVIDQVIETRTDAIVCDICSLKTPVIQALRSACRKGLKVASIHPMFGPDVQILAGRNVLICDVGDSNSSSEICKLFEDTAANVFHLDLEEHDRFMAYVLGLSHLVNLVFSKCLEQSGIRFDKLLETGSSTFIDQAAVSIPVCNENQDLYYEIQSNNAFSKPMIEGLQKVLENFKSKVLQQDRTGFKQMMEDCRLFFG